MNCSCTNNLFVRRGSYEQSSTKWNFQLSSSALTITLPTFLCIVDRNPQFPTHSLCAPSASNVTQKPSSVAYAQVTRK